jgi:hypothetical protein
MSAAKVIKTVVITDAMLTSSTVAENDYVAWNAATAYVVGNKAIRTSTHRIYERVTNGTTATAPENDTTNWLDIGPTNRWAAFDNVVGTATSGTSPLTIVLAPGGISGLGMLELVGIESVVTMKDAPGGAVVYSQTIDLDGSIIDDVFDWFFAEFEQRTDFVLTDLPSQFTSCELSITVTATSGNPSIGVCKPGTVIEIGRAQYGARVSIVDYSRKDTDAFGNTIITERAYSKRMSLSIVTDKAEFNRIFRRLAELRATPSICIGTELDGYAPLINYGFFKDFSIDVAYASHHICSLEWEGLI